MDFTPPSNPPIHANPISSIPSSRKLPIKRKTPNSNSSLILTLPNHDVTPTDPDVTTHNNNHPPFKFHRVWSEPDEIRLLQGLLDCSSKGLSFPKDLGTFYNIFSNGMSQPYSKSQLSEKLRRLRKKFRIITSRLDNGLDKDLLPVHDRALYDLSKQLWDRDREPEPEPEPDHHFVGTKLNNNNNNNNNSNSNDDNNNNKGKTNMAGVEVPSYSQPLPYSTAVLALPSVVKKSNICENYGDKYNKIDGVGLNGNDEGKVDVKVVGKEVRGENIGDELRSGIVRFASTTLADVVERSLKEMRRVVDVGRGLDVEKEVSFERRWREQYVAEFDVLAKRLKLIVEGCSMVGK